MRKLIVLFLLLLFREALHAQEKYALYLGSGASVYYGDLTDTFHPSLLHALTELGGTIYLTPGIGVQSHLCFTRLSGADSLSLSIDKQARNLSFRTPVSELSCTAVWELLPDKDFSKRRRSVRKHFTPYVTGGFSVLYFNPKAYYNGDWVKLYPLGTEGQFIKTKGVKHPEPYSRVTWAIPVGGGLSLRISPHLAIRAEASYRRTFSDYLDDVSGRYPQRDALLNTPNGATAIRLSDRSPSGVFRSGSPRGNPTSKDSYFLFTIGLSYFIRA